VLKQPLAVAEVRQEQRVANGGMETAVDGRLEGWTPWELGYEVDREVRQAGQASARCRNATAAEHRGLTYEVRLNQTVPAPILAEGWSRAENVSSGATGGDYSLYLDLEYMDGTQLWGQLAPFKPGTHDWQKRTVQVVPAKPVRRVLVHCIFRQRTGTAWFDEVRLWEQATPEGTQQYDGVPVTAVAAAQARALPGLEELGVGISVRDVAAGSGFVEPEFQSLPAAAGELVLEGTVAELELTIQARLVRLEVGVRVDLEVRDRSGRERALTVVCAHGVDATGWRWHDDQRASREIVAGSSYRNWVSVQAGANGMASRYPLACVSSANRALVIGVPLDVPRLARFAYEPGAHELYAAVDLGLSAATRNFPGRAACSVVLYPADPAWGFRAALAQYYRLFPQCFTKRNAREGAWMPFTDISTLERSADFGFQFQEGAPNPAFDEQHGIYSFVYVEPMSLWVAMPATLERSNERALAHVQELAAAGNRQMQAAASSVVCEAGGEWSGGIVKAPWCDGALYLLNPSPGLRPTPAEPVTQFEQKWEAIEQAFQRAGQHTAAWRPWEQGYEIVPGAGRNGSAAARMARPAGGGPSAGASQTVVINQKAAAPLNASVWTRARLASGVPDNNYALYIDVTYSDGSVAWGFVASAATGSHDWARLELRIEPAKPVHSLSYHLLFRAPHEGEVWFDDAFLAAPGTETNLIAQPGFEPEKPSGAPAAELDGTYIDSYEMAADVRNYRADHLAAAGIPLVFDGDGQVCQLGIFNTVEFTREVARRMQARGKMMFANSTPDRFPWGAACLDVMGTETNWAAAGKYTPNPDSVMNYRRALCYQRPYLLLLNTVYDEFKPEWVELYFKRCLAYAVFPGFFSHNAADNPYWGRPDLYNRDRPLFRRYLPAIQALSAAGWEPITYARSSTPSVYVERFGRPGGALYLTVFNDRQETQTAEIAVDLAALQLRSVPEALRAGALTLAAEDVRVITLAGPEVLK
jgi:hypothetical protein